MTMSKTLLNTWCHQRLILLLRTIILFPQTQSSRSDYLKLFLNLNAWFSTLALILIFVFLLRESFVALTEIRLSFLMDKSWYPLEGQYNLLPMLAGSLLITFCALLMSFPLGLFGALFAHFYCPQAFKKVFFQDNFLFFRLK